MTETMDNRGLKDRKKFRQDLLDIMKEQGIQAMGVAFTIPQEGKEPYADFDTFVNDDDILMGIDSALIQLRQEYDDQVSKRSKDALDDDLVRKIRSMAENILTLNGASDNVKNVVDLRIHPVIDAICTFKAVGISDEEDLNDRTTRILCDYILQIWNNLEPVAEGRTLKLK